MSLLKNKDTRTPWCGLVWKSVVCEVPGSPREARHESDVGLLYSAVLRVSSDRVDGHVPAESEELGVSGWS